MRQRLFLLVVLFAGLGGAVIEAQQATMTTPITPPTENNYRVESFSLARSSGGIWEVSLSVRDSGGTELRRLAYTGPDAVHPGATAVVFATAVTTIRATETGSIARKLDFRILGFLSDQCYIGACAVPPQPLTLVP